MEETGVPGENHRPAASHWKTWSHNVVSSTPRHERGFELTTIVVYASKILCQLDTMLLRYNATKILCY